MNSVLVREPVAESPWEDIDGELAEAAAEELGYRGLRIQHDISVPSLSLRKWLAERGISPFTQVSVGKYKAREKARQHNRYRLRTFVLGQVCLLIGALGLINYPAITRINSVIGICGGIVGALGLIILSASTFGWGKNPYEWVLVNLKEYKKPVPEFVLQTALDIKKAWPHAAFSICELVRLEHPGEHYDPFLVLNYNEELYIEVWNEPKYKQIREV